MTRIIRPSDTLHKLGPVILKWSRPPVLPQHSLGEEIDHTRNAALEDHSKRSLNRVLKDHGLDELT